MKKGLKRLCDRIPCLWLLLFVAALILACALYIVLMNGSPCITGSENNILGKIIEAFSGKV